MFTIVCCLVVGLGSVAAEATYEWGEANPGDLGDGSPQLGQGRSPGRGAGDEVFRKLLESFRKLLDKYVRQLWHVDSPALSDVSLCANSSQHTAENRRNGKFRSWPSYTFSIHICQVYLG